MEINIKTLAEGCHVTVNIKVQAQTLLNLTDNDEGSLNLFSGITYRFEWFVITAKDAHIKIEAVVTPGNDGFRPLIIEKNYPPGVQDGNVFLFTLN
jgi:hypothetical protein